MVAYERKKHINNYFKRGFVYKMKECTEKEFFEEPRKRFQLNQGYCIRDFDDECLVIPVGSDAIARQQIAIASPVGAFLIHQLQNQSRFEDLLEKVLHEYDVPEETAVRDLGKFLQELKKNHYLKEE